MTPTPFVPRVKLVEHVRQILDDEVLPHGRESWRLLGEWTGEHAASAAGAAPVSSPSSLPADPDEAQLTRVESLAVKSDRAMVTRQRFARLLVELVVRCEVIFDRIGVVVDPDRAPRLRVDQGLRFADECVATLEQPGLVASVPDQDLFDLQVLVEQLGALIVANHRPPLPARVACISCAEADLETDVANRYSRLRLCRWCGEFRAMHGRNPTPDLVRLHDRGVRITRDHLRRAGFRQGA